VPVAPESRRTDGEGGTTTERERGKFDFKLPSSSVVPTCQLKSQKQLLVLPPCMFAKVAVA
jgi:hypothetical protein